MIELAGINLLMGCSGFITGNRQRLRKPEVAYRRNWGSMMMFKDSVFEANRALAAGAISACMTGRL